MTLIVIAEGRGLEPPTAYAAPDFESADDDSVTDGHLRVCEPSGQDVAPPVARDHLDLDRLTITDAWPVDDAPLDDPVLDELRRLLPTLSPDDRSAVLALAVANARALAGPRKPP